MSNQLVRPAKAPATPVRDARKRRIEVDRPNELRRTLDRAALALLVVAQLAWTAALLYVALRALGYLPVFR